MSEDEQLTTLRRLERKLRPGTLFRKHRRAHSSDQPQRHSLQLEREAGSADSVVLDTGTPSGTPTGTPTEGLARERSHTLGSIEGDLYRKRSGSLVKALGGMMLSKRQEHTSTTATTAEPSPEYMKVEVVMGDDDTPESYVARLVEMDAAEAVVHLSSKDNATMQRCLAVFMQRFDFCGQSLDVALRRFLFESELPKETQQVDRVLCAFSARFYSCNKDLWDRADQVYFLTFSLMLLQTDHFNAHNKHKMTKDEFVKNSRVCDGSLTDNSFISRELLEYLYDNITHSKFIQRAQLTQPQSPPLYMLPKRMFTSSSSTNLDTLNVVTVSQAARSASISSTTSQFFQSQIDPYLLIVTDQLDSLKLSLDTIDETNPFVERSRPSFSKEMLRSSRDALINRNGTYIRFNKSCQWLTGKTETYVPPLDDNDACVSKQLVKVIKIAELFREEQTLQNKFFTIGGSGKSSWKRCFGILTLCGFFIFENLGFMTSVDREKVLSGQPLDEPMIISIDSDALLKQCSKLAINGLFACQSPSEEGFIFNIFSTNKKELFSVSTFEEMSSWIVAINYIAAMDSCHIRDYIAMDHEVLPIRNMRLEDKVTKLVANIPISKKEIDESLRLQKHIQTLTPFVSRTRESLIAYHRALEIRVDWLWYEVERNEVYINMLLYEQEYNNSCDDDQEDQSLLEDSFIIEGMNRVIL